MKNSTLIRPLSKPKSNEIRLDLITATISLETLAKLKLLSRTDQAERQTPFFRFLFRIEKSLSVKKVSMKIFRIFRFISGRANYQNFQFR